MSLINQMLQDLESRRSKPAPSNGDALNDLIWPGGSSAATGTSGLIGQISRSPVLRLAALVGIALLAAVIVWAVWRGLAAPRAPQETVAVVTEAAPPAPATPPAANTPAATDAVAPAAPEMAAPVPADPPATPAEVPAAVESPPAQSSTTSASTVSQIHGLRLSVLPDHTRVVLDASAPLTHRLSTDPGRIVLELEHAALAQPLPTLDLRKSLLHQIQTEPEGEQGLRLTLALRSAAQAKILTLAPEQGYGHRLVIDLYPEGVKANNDLALPGSTDPATTAPAPVRPAANTAARSLKKQRALSAAEQAEQAYQDGLLLLQQGHAEAAEPLLRQALALDVQHLKAREALVDALLKRARTQEAEAVLTEGIRLKPDYLLFTKLYARVLVDQGDTPAALAMLEDKAASASQDIEFQAFLAALYQRMERHNDAISAYRKALASQPQQGVWWMGLGISLEAALQQAEALEAYRKAQATGSLSPAVQDFVKGRISTLKAQVSG